MHELGITRNIVEIAERHAREQGATRVNSLTVQIGALSGVIAEAVEFAFEACSQETLLQGARLIIDAVPGRGRCRACGAESEIDRFTYACPHCDALALETVQGQELRILELEVD
ncbi:Hydrogenase-3 nickel incorporation protein HypA [Geoalkalibacter ferrihydriticus]|uniref:Hydrogenase maturation factor HypA n=2 Tax=Geoalkalibacter ferrihydriticus TaxID=392333 RepID=A0A0C2DPT6_9BACT|nr:hydrogenase maturation nickel metallochaperone HypA [Geoalkalibacter ferrihydriticus]KIH75394.1 hydrogenase nickel incorporation protein HypA [Geoalkalibacter ferrihydriticus DSM 17813]SDM53065.1 Hydrogenase-3 nickel incorporation protein HypA [Geoalkalibacter ferrihydriticus]